MSETETVPPLPDSSRFFWMSGGLFLAAAAILGLAAVLKLENGERQASEALLHFALPSLLAAMTLFIAHCRRTAWTASSQKRTESISEREDSGAKSLPAENALCRADILAILAVTILAVLPRWPTLFHSFWYDELWTLHFIRNGPAHALTYQEGYNNHLLNSALSSLCLEARRLLTGEASTQGMPPSWLARLPAFLFGVLAVPMLYGTVLKPAGRMTAVLAAVLLALAPAAVDFSGQNRGYSGLLFFTVAQTFWLARALHSGAGRDWVGWLMSAGFGTLSHLYFLLVIAVDGLFLLLLILWYLIRGCRSSARNLLEQALFMGTAWAAVLWMEYVSVYPELEKIQTQLAGTEPMARAHDVLLPMLQAWGGIPEPPWDRVFYVVSAVLALFGLWHLIRNAAGTALFLLLLLIVPMLLIEVVQPHYVYMRFFLLLLPAFLTLPACGIRQLSLWLTLSKPERVIWQWTISGVAGAGFAVLLLPGLWRVMRYPKQNFAGASQALQGEIAKGRTVALVGIGSEWFAEYGLWGTPQPDSEQKLRRLIAGKQTILLVDTDMMLHPKRAVPGFFPFLRRLEGKPIRVFRGRNSSWPYSYLDGDSDIKFYLVSATGMPPVLSEKHGIAPQHGRKAALRRVHVPSKSSVSHGAAFRRKKRR